MALMSGEVLRRRPGVYTTEGLRDREQGSRHHRLIWWPQYRQAAFRDFQVVEKQHSIQ